jgi:asparagine synthase (glutamine-hydrolysing)
MFAVALWDVNKRVGLLARDRMGKKPLYYYQKNGALYFASEIKSLLTIPGFDRKISMPALSYFLSLKHVPCPLTIFENIKVLPPAHSLVFHSNGETVIQRYWDIDFSTSEEIARQSADELTEQLLNLLKKGVKKRLMSDVPIGFFLSGGIDSSLSTAIAAEMSSDPIKTFTLTYADNSTTEGKELDKKWARYTAAKYKTEHYEESVRFSSFPESLRKIIGHFDEPFAGTISTYFLAGLIAKHVKVALSGDGADELFGSYLSHRLAAPLANYQDFLKNGQQELVMPFQSQLDYLEKMYEPDDWKWRAKLLMHPDDEKTKLFSRELKPVMSAFTGESLLKADFAKLTANDPLNRILESEYRTLFPDQILAFVDRLSMAHSLEVRSAFVDTELVEFAARLPGHLKIKNGETKYILKKAALKYFPEEMVFRKKEGFVMPITEWLLTDLESYVRETLSSERLAEHGFFDKNRVDELVNDLYRSPSNYVHANKVFSLLVFQEWYDLYIKPQTVVPSRVAGEVRSL